MQTILKEPNLANTLVPAFSWTELEERLSCLAETPVKKSMVPALVSAVRKGSWALPSAHVLDEILTLAWVLGDQSFQPELETEPDEIP